MELYELTVHELQDKLAGREISSGELVKSFLQRIATVEPGVRAFLTLIDENALQKAGEMDEEGKFESLRGIPFALKDIFCTRGVKTTCGSRILENFVPTYDSTAGSRLNEQGGILLGKLNMDEFAMGSSTEQSGFFPTANPWDLERVPG
ncbi:MAG: amidase, partial [Syntrophomonas sp.]